MKKTLFDLPAHRQERILEQLQKEGRVLARHLALHFETSEDTIRRDLKELADRGQCKRVHGGAVTLSPAGGSFEKRLGEDFSAKQIVGRAAAKLVESSQILFIDVSTTNLEVARALDPKLKLTIITNSPVIAAELYDRPNYELILLGGRVDPHIGGTLGAKTIHEIKQIHADLLFLGACGLHLDRGMTTFNYDDADVKKAMVENSERIVVAAQLSKVNTAATYSVAPLSVIDQLVLEGPIDEAFDLGFRKAGLEIVVADQEAP